MSSPYEQLEALFQKLYNLSHLLSLAGWDAAVAMPPKGAKARSAATSELMQYTHGLLTSAETRALLEAAEKDTESLSGTQRANLREMRRSFNTQSALPSDFVRRKSAITTPARLLWAKCRAANDFATFLPTLKEIIALTREEAQLRSAATGEPLYESLFHMYEPGLSLDRVHAIFAEVKSWLPELLRKIIANTKDQAAEKVELQLPLSVKKQEELGRYFVQLWGFDLEAGRLDVSAHAFTGMTKEDTRLTTNYGDDNYDQALFATIHEANHGMYEQNCGPREMLGQPVCRARSLGIHESQSLFAEMMVARSAAFAEYMTPYLKEYLGDQPAFTVEHVRLMNQAVAPDFIRTMADEVSYPLHVILRYEIERALVEGDMEAEDIPRVWNEKMKAYLGLETQGRDDIGCLQDIHWSQSSFGYFPTYSLGAMFSAQLMATIKKELGEDTVKTAIRTGKLQPILAKQKEKIWDQGCLYETEELMIKATGEPLNPKYFREHLERRYLRKED